MGFIKIIILGITISIAIMSVVFVLVFGGLGILSEEDIRETEKLCEDNQGEFYYDKIFKEPLRYFCLIDDVEYRIKIINGRWRLVE